jgi:hypothetical protein
VVLDAGTDSVAVDLRTGHVHERALGVGTPEAQRESGGVVTQHVVALQAELRSAGAEQGSLAERVELDPAVRLDVHASAETDEVSFAQQPTQVGVGESRPGRGGAGDETVLVGVEQGRSREHGAHRRRMCVAGAGRDRLAVDEPDGARFVDAGGAAASCNAGLVALPTGLQPRGKLG